MVEPHREHHDVEHVLRGLHRWIRKNTLMLAPLNPFEPDRYWFGPTSMEITMLFPGMHKRISDARDMARELVQFLRTNAACVRVGLLQLDADCMAPLICMRVQQAALPGYWVRSDSISINYSGLRILNRQISEAAYALERP